MLNIQTLSKLHPNSYTRMKKLFFLLFLAMSQFASAQNDLLAELQDKADSSVQLLPPRMLISQRILWGEKGLMRPIIQLNTANREKELKVRRAMLVAHQVLGFITLGGMAGQAYTGSQLYKGNYGIKDVHENLATAVNITYGATAAMSFFAPPPLLNRDKKTFCDSITQIIVYSSPRWHDYNKYSGRECSKSIPQGCCHYNICKLWRSHYQYKI